MQRLKDKGFVVALQILNNECSKEYERRMTEKWGVKFQLVPPDMHRQNAADCAIHLFKTSLPSLQVWQATSHATFGTCSYHRPK